MVRRDKNIIMLNTNSKANLLAQRFQVVLDVLNIELRVDFHLPDQNEIAVRGDVAVKVDDVDFFIAEIASELRNDTFRVFSERGDNENIRFRRLGCFLLVGRREKNRLAAFEPLFLQDFRLQRLFVRLFLQRKSHNERKITVENRLAARLDVADLYG